MKIAIVGPSHPYKGGIAKHTSELASRLQASGKEVDIISWRHQYPFFYPGEQFVPDDKPEVPLVKMPLRVLSWRAPWTWVRWGKKLRQYDKVIFIWWVPTIQGPIYLTMIRMLSNQDKAVLLCHNVLPHEGKPGDRQLTRSVIKRVSGVIVHSRQQEDIARSLGARIVRQIDLPPVFPPKNSALRPALSPKRQLLFFGLVRPYKGLDVLIKALAQVPDVHLTVAGEIWGENIYAPLALQHRVADRISFIDSYVPDSELQKLFIAADALVLPYRGGTATFNAAYGHYFGLPVIATRAASLPDQVRNGVDGLLCNPDDPNDLAQTIQEFYQPGMFQKLRRNIPKVTGDLEWKAYLQAIVKNT